MVLVVLVSAFAAWWFLFRLPPAGIWTRTWVAAVALSLLSIATLVAGGEVDRIVGPNVGWALLAGGAVGVGWLVATHVGHALLCRQFPSFLDRVSDLYALRAGDRVGTMVGPVVAMSVAEELVFRGVVQGRMGLVAGVVAYTAVQLVTGNWALTLAGASCGAVWGVLAWITGGLVAPIVAHVIWTSALTFVWPLRGCGRRLGAADLAPVATDEHAGADAAVPG